MSKSLVLISAIVICSAIILGAMAAHSLEKILSADLIETFEKGVRYQFYAGFSLLILGFAKEKIQFSLKAFTWMTLAGLMLFSGCLYGYCFYELVPSLKPLVYLVPFGGSLMIAAWVVFIVQVIRFQK